MQFSLDRKRRSHKRMQRSVSDSVGLIFTRSHRSTLLITTPTTTPSLVKTSLKARVIEVRITWVSNYSCPITKSSNRTPVIEHPRDLAPNTWQIGPRRSNHDREFVIDKIKNKRKPLGPGYFTAYSVLDPSPQAGLFKTRLTLTQITPGGHDPWAPDNANKVTRRRNFPWIKVFFSVSIFCVVIFHIQNWRLNKLNRKKSTKKLQIWKQNSR